MYQVAISGWLLHSQHHLRHILEQTSLSNLPETLPLVQGCWIDWLDRKLFQANPVSILLP
jgi:hypothetical protein